MLRIVRTHRPATALATAAVLALSLLVAGPAAAVTPKPYADITPAPSHLPQTPIVDVTPHLVDLTFPVAEPDRDVRFIDDFLYLRGGGSRLHAATDVMAPKHRPIHAAVGGTITSAPTSPDRYGWAVHLRGDDGLRYTYIHLNDDTPKRDSNGRWLDDDKGGMTHAYAPRIVEAIKTTGRATGLRIERGELIGWNGDSGNAKGVAPHLHLEIEVAGPDGAYRINPYHSLKAALARGDVPGAVSETRKGVGGYADVYDGDPHTPAILRLTDSAVVTGCEPARYCPSDAVTRGDLAAYLAAAKGLVPVAGHGFSDVASNDPNAGAIGAVVEAGMLRGHSSTQFRPTEPLDRAQLATVLVQGFDLPTAGGSAPFGDVRDGDVHAANIAAAYAAQLTQGCGDGANYCGRESVRRGQIASFLVAALDAG